jgi:RHS repeat-associated protein
LPQEILFVNGDRSVYKYNAAGAKYQVVHYTHLDTELNPVQGNGEAQYEVITYDYNGSYVYRDHYLNMLMTSEGYVHYNEMTPELCFYAKDHLGNNRATYYVTPIAESGVQVKEINNYYPFGMEFNEKPVITNVGFNPELNFTYNGKELQTMHGLNMMDYGARFIDMSKPDWIGVDPLAEKKPWMSPYVYCSNNPVNRIDPDGRNDYTFDTENRKVQVTKTADANRYFIVNQIEVKTGENSSVSVEVPKQVGVNKVASILNDNPGLFAQVYGSATSNKERSSIFNATVNAGKEKDARNILPVIFAPLAATGAIAAAPAAIAAGQTIGAAGKIAADYTVYGMLKGAVGLGKAGQFIGYNYLRALGVLESGGIFSVLGGIGDGLAKSLLKYSNNEPYLVSHPRFQIWSDITSGSISTYDYIISKAKK